MLSSLPKKSFMRVKLESQQAVVLDPLLVEGVWIPMDVIRDRKDAADETGSEWQVF
jgi:hypothetical protein